MEYSNTRRRSKQQQSAIEQEAAVNGVQQQSTIEHAAAMNEVRQLSATEQGAAANGVQQQSALGHWGSEWSTGAVGACTSSNYAGSSNEWSIAAVNNRADSSGE